MPQGGRITVHTLANPRPNGTPPMVSLLVEDTGCGMDDATLARLFEPFFTTKPAGHGTGLGLATVQRIVSEAGGTIEVNSDPGRGTRIEVLIPALESVPAARPPATRASTKPTILLVDDHTSARQSIQRVLHHAGYRVLPAASGKRALKMFAESTNHVGLLIADWMMPGMSGRELAEQLLRQKPGLKVLLISGYHDPREETPVGSVELIRKPFAGRVLLERIRQILDSEGDASW
jgi:CheY-like chemotaxis protein